VSGRVGAEDPDWLTRRPEGVVVAVKAVPRARITSVVGEQAGALRVKIAAPPHKGQSNAALTAFLADAAGCRPSAARIRRGSGGARKLVEIDGDPAALASRLAALAVEVP
jgi:uncharacterized protein YggU (UPF0235/DUF167 family)